MKLARPAGFAAAIAMLGALAFLGAGAVRSARTELAIAAVWEDVQAARWDAVLVATETLLEDADARARAAELRCWALLAHARRAECGSLLDDVMAAGASAGTPTDPAWLPDPILIRIAVGHRSGRGAFAEAAALAARGRVAHPEDPVLLQLELAARGALGEAAGLVAELEGRLAAEPAQEREPSPALLAARVALARHYREAADWDASLRALGAHPPRRPTGDSSVDALHAAWFDERAGALAAQGRIEAVRALFAQWREYGAEPDELAARYALRLSTSQLVDPERSWKDLLREAIARSAELRDARLRVHLFERLIAHHLADGEHALALAVFDEAAAAGVELAGTTRAQLERGVALELRDSHSSGNSDDSRGAVAEVATLRFRIPAQLSGGELRVSNAAAEPDADLERHALDGEADEGWLERTVERAPAAWPERWVVRDARGRVRGSGSAWVPASGVTDVEVRVREPVAAPAFRALPARSPADGRRRVFALILDCGDWRLVQYLRSRGELPVLEALFGQGHRAVLESDPPLTAAAMESLVWPQRAGPASFVGIVHELGVEIAGLAAVGRNPFRFLAPLLPAGANLFEVVGAGPLVAANMLFTHGLIDAGQHAEMIGPQGRRRVVETAGARRPLRPAERAAHPGLLVRPEARGYVESIAAEFDSAAALARAGEVDLLALRIEALDILTHALYSELARTQQDDGHAGLLAVYRYIDERIGALHAALDVDDVLLVLSDHGIRTAMEHDRDAIFLAVGEGMPPGRAQGRPDLRGIPLLVTRLLGVETGERDWPATGIAEFVESRPSVESEPTQTAARR